MPDQPDQPDQPAAGYRLDDDAVIAAIEVIGRSGATDFAFGYLDEDVAIADARWWAHAQYRGARITVENHAGPVEAAEALAVRIIHGGLCTGCQRVAAMTDDPVPVGDYTVGGVRLDPAELQRRGACRWVRVGRRWEQGCGTPAPDGSTRERLARALAEAGAPSVAIRQAREGHWDEYLGPQVFPIVQLVSDLEANGLHALAARARAGEFDATYFADASSSWRSRTVPTPAWTTGWKRSSGGLPSVTPGRAASATHDGGTCGGVAGSAAAAPAAAGADEGAAALFAADEAGELQHVEGPGDGGAGDAVQLGEALLADEFVAWLEDAGADAAFEVGGDGAGGPPCGWRVGRLRAAGTAGRFGHVDVSLAGFTYPIMSPSGQSS